MDLVESIKEDKLYLKCKRTVKSWEKDFKIKYARTPSKLDIKEAPAKIKYAYKKYFQLKSVALENSLSVCDFEDESQLSQSPEQVTNLESSCESPHLQSEQLLPDLPTGQELERLLSSNKQTKSQSVEFHNQFADNLSKKIFQSRKFSLRNPRKMTVSKTQSVTEMPNNIAEKSTCEASTFIPTIEENVYSNISFTTESSSTYTLSSVTSVNNMVELVPKVRQVDGAWLERATGLNNTAAKDKSNTNLKSEFGLRNVNVIKLAEKPFDYIENSESEEEDNISINKLKSALKKRRLDSGVHSVDKEKSNMKNQVTNESRNCDKSSNIKAKRMSQHKKQRLQKNIDECNEQQPPNIAQYVPFGLEEDIIPRHRNITNILSTFKTDLMNESKIENSCNAKEFDKLANKIKSGTLNDNFVKINIEKKVFVRGKKNINFSKYKKQQWKNKKSLHGGMEFPETGKITCYKCSSTGHMARYCTAHRGDALLPLDNYEENTLPSLDDMQDIVDKEANNMTISDQLSLSIYKSSQIPDAVMKVLAKTQDNNTNIKPIYSYGELETPKELYEALHKFGHETFRSGQEEAIKRILCGMSTLLILSTGGGKSLCYQLPAYIYSQHYKCITLVISPLVSLMEDQVLSMPDFLKAGCLHTNQPPTQRQKIIQCLKNGEINILLISPEALVSGDLSNGFSGIFKSLPQIAFACIDEVHCVSQWSHNFRPSYLMICRVLQEKLKIKCILGLTATASQQTIKSVINHINIPDNINGVIINPTLPDNLCLSVSYEKNKDQALVAYLRSEHISSFNSIIVYCIRRDECERVAALLRSCLQEPNKLTMERQHNKRKRMSYIAEAYHAGMSGAQRKKIQKHFMDGTLKIIVATVAFGMGINKSNIRCIIHYNMPSSFESYVQEVGRAGRDGKNAYCHVFMNDSNNDKNELLKHIYANSIDRPTIRKLLQKVFVPCNCNCDKNEQLSSESASTSMRCKGHEIGIPIDSTVEELDLPSENIATLLCYVELHSKKYIKVLNNAYTLCKIASYGGPAKILEAAKTCSPLAMAYLLLSKKDPNILTKNILVFNVIEVAAAIGWESGLTKYHLKNLEWKTEEGVPKRSLLKVEFNTLGFRIKAPGDLRPFELDSILEDLHGTVIFQEKTMLYQLEEINVAFTTIANYSLENFQLSGTFLDEKSNELKSIIRTYFQRNETLPIDIMIKQRPLDVDRITSDVRALISSYKDCNFTGRSIARIFQGISSPNYPAIVWGRCKFWRSHIHEDFHGIIKIATQQILTMKMA
ncbi:ATP-dependent DNA helicase Q4 [Galleria mellonella]|uniref:DNA 3'-5' helicase n=1 Tax=Galleria mellonella TaxID=7137 RepID=A0A6J1X199_GALME|nr:ATP-dependent DNA helicase Q4 [Galleria mellonella]